MPIVNVANHFIEESGKPIDPDTQQHCKNKKEKLNIKIKKRSKIN